MPGGRNTTWPSVRWGGHDAGNIGLCNGGRRNQYQVGTGDRLANIRADFGNGDVTLACFVFQCHDWTVQQGLQLSRVATPQTYFVTLFAQVCRCCVTTVPAT